MVHTIDWSLATLIADDACWGKTREWYLAKVRAKDGPKRYTRKVKGVAGPVTVAVECFVRQACCRLC